MDHNEQMLSRRHSDGNETRLLRRVLWIGNRPGQWISENGRCIFEGNAMLPEVERSLLRVPLEFHPPSLQPAWVCSGPFWSAEHISLPKLANQLSRRNQISGSCGAVGWVSVDQRRLTVPEGASKEPAHDAYGLGAGRCPIGSSGKGQGARCRAVTTHRPGGSHFLRPRGSSCGCRSSWCCDPDDRVRRRSVSTPHPGPLPGGERD